MVIIKRLAGLLAFLLTLSGCVPSVSNELRFGLETSPITLDPRYATDAVSSRVIRLLYQPLIDFDDKYRAVPLLADWQRLTDTHYRFTLRRPAQFHHGKILDSSDIYATYDAILNGPKVSPFRAQLDMISMMKIIDSQRIDFFLSRKDNLFISRMNIPVMPADLIAGGHDFSSQPVGTGAFKFLSWNTQEDLRLLRLADNAVIRFLQVKSPTVRILKLLNRELDIIQNDMTPELVRHLQQQPGIIVSSVKGTNFSYIGFNLNDAIAGRLEIRQALAQGINTADIIRYILNNDARPALSILTPEHWAGGKHLLALPYNQQAARQKLAQLGYDANNPLKIVYKTSADPLRLRIATVIQDQLRRIGVEVKIQSHDWGTFYGDIKSGNFQMYSLSWVAIKSPDVFENVFHSNYMPPKGANRGHYRNAQVDKLIEASQTVADLTTQLANYESIQQYVLNDLPYIPLWYENHIVAHHGYVSGYYLQDDGNYDSLQTIKW